MCCRAHEVVDFYEFAKGETFTEAIQSKNKADCRLECGINCERLTQNVIEEMPAFTVLLLRIFSCFF